MPSRGPPVEQGLRLSGRRPAALAGSHAGRAPIHDASERHLGRPTRRGPGAGRAAGRGSRDQLGHRGRRPVGRSSPAAPASSSRRRAAGAGQQRSEQRPDADPGQQHRPRRAPPPRPSAG